MTSMFFIFNLLLSLLTVSTVIPCSKSLSEPVIPMIKSPLTMSNDGGRSWMEITREMPTQMPICFNAVGNEYFLGSGKGIFRGPAMVPATKWTNELLSENEIVGIFPGKTGPYVTSLWNGFFQYEPLSGSWVPVHNNLKEKNVHAVLELDQRTIVIGTGSGIYRTEDHGASWQHALPSGSIDRLQEKNNILIACGDQGLFRSTDGGGSWVKHHIAAERPFFINALDDRWITIFEGQDFAGVRAPNMVFQSTDDGNTWSPVTYKLPSAMQGTYDIRQIGKYLIGSGHDALYRSSDNGNTWEPVLKLPSNRGGFMRITDADQKLFVLYIEGC